MKMWAKYLMEKNESNNVATRIEDMKSGVGMRYQRDVWANIVVAPAWR